MLESILQPITHVRGIETTLRKGEKSYFKYDEYLKDKFLSYITPYNAGLFFALSTSMFGRYGRAYLDNVIRATWLTLVNKNNEIIADRINLLTLATYTDRSYCSKLMLLDAIDWQKCFIEFTGADEKNGRRVFLQLFWNENPKRKLKPMQSLELVQCRIKPNSVKNYFPYSQKLVNRRMRQLFVNPSQFPRGYEDNSNQYENIRYLYINLILVDSTGQEVVRAPIYTFCPTNPGFIHQFNGVVIDWEKSYIEFENVVDVELFTEKGIELNVTFEEIQ